MPILFFWRQHIRFSILLLSLLDLVLDFWVPSFIFIALHCKCFDHKSYGDWKLRGPCRENLHYLWKRAVRIAGKPCDNYRSCNYHGVSLQFLQPISIDSADFPCRDPAISSPRSFYGQNICSVDNLTVLK
jgi:hypothetical protein